MAKSSKDKSKLKAVPKDTPDASDTIVLNEDSGIEIRSATLKGDFCNYSYDLLVAPNTTDTINRKSSLLIHDDLKALFKKLHPHLAVICEEINKDEIPDIEKIDDYDHEEHTEDSLENMVAHFTVSSFAISATGENEAVTISGSRRLSTGDYKKIETYPVKWTGGYAFIHELRALVDELKVEVEKYMMGKCAPRLVQQEMTFPEEGQPEDNE
ncbi:MAG: hypothetical protein V4450_07270 [Bacteroidota bacterium]